MRHIDGRKIRTVIHSLKPTILRYVALFAGAAVFAMGALLSGISGLALGLGLGFGAGGYFVDVVRVRRGARSALAPWFFAAGGVVFMLVSRGRFAQDGYDGFASIAQYAGAAFVAWGLSMFLVPIATPSTDG
jgi:hypothetical protein